MKLKKLPGDALVNTVVPGFRALGPSTPLSALNLGSALFPILDLEHFEL